MTSSQRGRHQWPVIAGMILIAAGCSATEPSRFYTLESMVKPATEGTPPAGALPTIVIGSVSLPKYLDRPQVVTRPEPFVATLAEFDRWIEPLEDMLLRIVAENLAALLHTDRVVINPRYRPSPPAYQADLMFLRFDIDQNNRAVLTARWTLVNRSNDQVIAAHRTSVIQPAAASSYEARVQALSEAVAVLCREIADQLRRSVA